MVALVFPGVPRFVEVLSQYCQSFAEVLSMPCRTGPTLGTASRSGMSECSCEFYVLICIYRSAGGAGGGGGEGGGEPEEEEEEEEEEPYDPPGFLEQHLRRPKSTDSCP